MKNGHRKKSVVTFIIIVLLAFLHGCDGGGQNGEPSGEATEGQIKTPVPGFCQPSPQKHSISSQPASPSQDADVDALLSSMTLEQKAGQLFFIASRHLENGERRLAMDESLKETIKRLNPGGFILFSENMESISQTALFISSLQSASNIPLFISIDEEGGIVSRLNKAEKLHSTVMPPPYDIGRTGNAEYAYLAAKAIAEEIRSLGFNMNFAPVADVFSNPQNKAIGKRAYGSDAHVAGKMVAKAVKGYQDQRIIPVLKHFPGHGDTAEDSHTHAAIVNNDLERLKSLEFIPFQSGIEAGAEVVMTAHVLTPKITDDGLPATLSGRMIRGILREQLGFNGLIITDGLEMSAISAYYPEEEAVVLAISAGVDMLLLPRDFEKAYHAVLTAVKEGRISEERINESVLRILKLKAKYQIGQTAQAYDPEKIIGSLEHMKIAEKIRKEIVP